MAGLVNYGSSDEEDNLQDEAPTMNVSSLKALSYKNLMTDDIEDRRATQPQLPNPRTVPKVVSNFGIFEDHGV